MEVNEAIRNRYSCRAYIDKPVEQEKLDSLLEAARLAPSAKNTQDWRFVVVTYKETRCKLANTTNKPDSFKNAGVIIAGCSNSRDVMTCGQAIAQIDVAIALEHICLQATELGLGTCWIGSFKTDQVRLILGIPDDIEIIELLAIGYPADTWKKPNRETIENIICYEKWKF
jgi:nitroreductase